MTWRTYTIRNLATGSIRREYAPDLSTAFSLARGAMANTSADLECVSSIEGMTDEARKVRDAAIERDDAERAADLAESIERGKQLARTCPPVIGDECLQDRKANEAGGYPF